MKLKEAEDILRSFGIDGAREEARYIFSRIGNIPSYKLIAQDAECNIPEVVDAIRRRSEREPLGYIIGEVNFYRESYRVTPDCLIPRPDTEILVETAIKHLPENAKFLDLCTGSGCVALSVLNNTVGTSAIAADISEGALSVARENADRLSLSDRIELRLYDVLTERIPGEFAAMLSNPPYVTSEEYVHLEPEIYREPKSAFVGGEDGGDFYRRLTELYLPICERGGFIAYEIGYEQGELLVDIAKKSALNCEIIKDLAGRDRVALLRKG